jgi:surfeit locus 1 family protein
MFSRRWLGATLLVLIGVGILVRLGFWQLERLQQRREFNARVQSQVSLPELSLDNAALEENLVNMEYRPVAAVGTYDFSQEVALRNQAEGGRLGVHLITPLRLKGSEQSVLVDRGWIPEEDFSSGNWARYAEPGEVQVRGVIRRSQSQPDFGWRSDATPVPGGERLAAWNFVNVPAISQQVPYALLPVYIQQAPDPTWLRMPVRSQPHLDLSEGPHQGYALQWFTFAVILGAGYPFFIYRREKAGA